jgi:Icc-related predicted phosphoesterase
LPFLAQEVREHALQCQAWLREALVQPFDGTTVVVTHFAPSLRSADPRYGLVPGTAGFCNALDDLLPHAQLWLHGHLHSPQDYMHQGCRVVANPLGYARKNEQAFFRAGATIEV